MNKLTGPISWRGLVLAGSVGTGALCYYKYEKERLLTQSSSKRVVSTGKALLGGPWTLVDSASRVAVTDASFHGQHTLLYFGFTRCPDICPNELVRLGKVVDAFENVKEPQNQLQPIFVSVDPVRDSIQQMEIYKQDFHPKMKFLTGTRDQIGDITKAYRVYFNKAVDTDQEEDDDDYLIDHSIVMYLLNPEGEFVDFFTQSAQVSDIIKRIRQSMTAPPS